MMTSSNADSETRSSERSNPHELNVPQTTFRSLPFELRSYIWELAFPELKTPKPRVLELPVRAFLGRVSWYGPNLGAQVDPSGWLAASTERARVLGAINKETRQMMLKAYPDDLLVGHEGAAKFNKDLDVVYLVGKPSDLMFPNWGPDEMGFISRVEWTKVKNLALNPESEVFIHLASQCPQLSNLYYVTGNISQNIEEVIWRLSDLSGRDLQTRKACHRAGIRGESQRLFCWPSCRRENYYEVNEEEHPSEREIHWWEEDHRIFGFELTPMVVFNSAKGLALYNKLRAYEGLTDYEEMTYSDVDYIARCVPHP